MDLTVERTLSDALAIVLLEAIRHSKTLGEEDRRIKCDYHLVQLLSWKHPFLVHRVIKGMKSPSCQSISAINDDEDQGQSFEETFNDLKRFIESHSALFDLHSSADLPFSECDASEVYVRIKNGDEKRYD